YSEWDLDNSSSQSRSFCYNEDTDHPSRQGLGLDSSGDDGLVDPQALVSSWSGGRTIHKGVVVGVDCIDELGIISLMTSLSVSICELSHSVQLNEFMQQLGHKEFMLENSLVDRASLKSLDLLPRLFEELEI
ncbi:hypothetical protein FOZ63_023722, partial [Perkinsus olseni]